VTPPQPAWDELRTLLATMRPDWPAELTERQVDGAMYTAVPFGPAVVEAVRQAVDPDCGRLVLTARRMPEQPSTPEARAALIDQLRASLRGGEPT
jgi:hypothetical protein